MRASRSGLLKCIIVVFVILLPTPLALVATYQLTMLCDHDSENKRQIAVLSAKTYSFGK